MSRDPQTPEEWQDAVDTADFLLLLDAARQYGLVEGGPGVDVERCADILARGAAIGVIPRGTSQKNSQKDSQT
jgi:hypothetical protein